MDKLRMQSGNGVVGNIAKIACAEKLFDWLSGAGIYYHKVTNYDDLMKWVK